METPLQKLRDALARAITSAGLDAALIPERGGIDALCGAARHAGLDESVVCRAQAEAMGVDFAESLGAYPTSSEFVAAVPISFARRYKMLGLAPADAAADRVTIAVGDMGCWEQLQVVG